MDLTVINTTCSKQSRPSQWALLVKSTMIQLLPISLYSLISRSRVREKLMVADPHQQIISQLVEEEEDGKKVRIYRLPMYMKQRAPEVFMPLELFVGFYTHTTLVTEDDPMHLDISKLAIAREFCRGPEPDAPPLNNVRRAIKPQVWADFVSTVEAELKNARGNYDRLMYDASAVDRENEVVALDALFILAYLRFSYSFHDTWGYDFGPVFEHCRFNASRFPLLRDLLMLENQVPMSLLLAVMKHLSKPSPQSPTSEEASEQLYDLLEWFVMAVYPFNHGTKLDVSTDDLQRHLEGRHKNGCDSFVGRHHLLDCAYLAICGPRNPLLAERSQQCGELFAMKCFMRGTSGASDVLPCRNSFRIPSATRLERMRITVKVTAKSLTMSSIRFAGRRHKYVLLVPKVIMNDYTASIFKNLALYEQIKDNAVNFNRGEMRTYLFLMSSLLDSVQDVRLLIKRGVIVDQLGSAEAVCKQWNQMCDGLYIPHNPPSYWSHLQNRISQLEKSKSNRWFAEIVQRNCPNPVVFAAFVIVSLAFISTYLSAIFQVLAYVAM